MTTKVLYILNGLVGSIDITGNSKWPPNQVHVRRVKQNPASDVK